MSNRGRGTGPGEMGAEDIEKGKTIEKAYEFTTVRGEKKKSEHQRTIDGGQTSREEEEYSLRASLGRKPTQGGYTWGRRSNSSPGSGSANH